MLKWPSEDSVTVPARRQHVAKLGKVLWEALPALNQCPIYGSISPTASIHRSQIKEGRNRSGTITVIPKYACMLSHLSGVWLFAALWTGGGYHSLLQEIFLTQGPNLHLQLGRQILYFWATWEAPSDPLSIPASCPWDLLLCWPWSVHSKGKNVLLGDNDSNELEVKIPLATLGTIFLWINSQRRELMCWRGWLILTPRGNWTTTP